MSKNIDGKEKKNNAKNNTNSKLTMVVEVVVVLVVIFVFFMTIKDLVFVNSEANLMSIISPNNEIQEDLNEEVDVTQTLGFFEATEADDENIENIDFSSNKSDVTYENYIQKAQKKVEKKETLLANANSKNLKKSSADLIIESIFAPILGQEKDGVSTQTSASQVAKKSEKVTIPIEIEKVTKANVVAKVEKKIENKTEKAKKEPQKELKKDTKKEVKEKSKKAKKQEVTKQKAKEQPKKEIKQKAKEKAKEKTKKETKQKAKEQPKQKDKANKKQEKAVKAKKDGKNKEVKAKKVDKAKEQPKKQAKPTVVHSQPVKGGAYDARTIRAYITGAKKYTGKDKLVFLTFDDGPSSDYTATVLNTLKKYGVKATFFIVGRNANQKSAGPLLRREVAEGHAIALHSYSHNYKYLYPKRRANADHVIREVDKNLAAIRKHLGKNFTTAVFRYPGGHMSWKSMGGADKALANRGITYIDWNVISGDAVSKKDPKYRQSALQSIKNDMKAHGYPRVVVVLMHDIKRKSVVELPAIIEYYRDAGYKFGILK